MTILASLQEAFRKIPAGNIGRLATALDAAYAPLALHAVIGSAETTLTNTTPNSTSYVQWGTEEAVIAQASAPVSCVVLAWLSGTMVPGPAPAVNDRGQAKLEVSFNGGSTWADMAGDMAPGLFSTNTNTSIPVARQGRATGTVSGDIQVRAQVRDVAAANDTSWDRGRILVVCHPQ